jgi:integrase
MRKTLTDRGVKALKARPARYAYPDPELTGHYVRVQPSGAKSFVTVARDPVRKKQVWSVIAATDVMSIDAAREKARDAIKRVRAGKSALEAPAKQPDSFEAVAEQWLKRHVQKKGLRSEHEIKRLLKAHVYPKWKKLALVDIRRNDVIALLDEVEDDHGARQADYVLAIVRGIMNWFAARHDDYHPAIVPGMKRQSAVEQARERILTDDEIRVIWKQAEANGSFGAFVRLGLLTGQRRSKIATMKRSDISDGTWTIPKAPREKGNAGELVLPEMARAIIDSMPQLGNNPYVFAGRGNSAINSYSKLKLEFDAKLPHDKDKPLIAPWTIHDLRRTFRSLLSRAGVRPDIAERCMGHAIEGVEGVYDKHSYSTEKANALKSLATLVDGIVHPRDNVVPMKAKRRRG